MKFTQYFLFTKERPGRQDIKLEWIEQVFFEFEHKETQSDEKNKTVGNDKRD